MQSDKLILILGSLAAVLLLLTGGLWLSRSGNSEFAQCRAITPAKEMRGLGGAFTLTDQNGNRVTDAEVFARPALLYFGYTYCPDVCPMDTARNAEAVTILQQRGIDLTPVFISVDPRRDTPEVLADFAGIMHERLIALTGTSAEIDAVSKAWRNYYRLNDQYDKENYLVDHMTYSYLLMPGAGAVERFDRDLSAQEIADRAACFITAADQRI